MFIAGAIIGSFLNVVIYRMPRQISIVTPGSHCPRCEEPLKWYDNIPLVSYLILRGQCRKCGLPISMRYPTIELLSAVLWLAAAMYFGLTWSVVPAVLFISSLIAIFYIDLDHYIIPNVIVFPVAAVGLGMNIAISLTSDNTNNSFWQPWYVYLIAGSAAALFFFIVALLYPGGMGMGDVKLAGMLGFFLGSAIFPALFLAFLIGAVTGVYLIAAGKKGRKSRIPFGPYLAIGALIALFYGHRLLDLWLNWTQGSSG